MESKYELLASTRYDPLLRRCNWNNDEEGPSAYMLLPYHVDRLLEASKLHGWEAVGMKLTYGSLKAACQVVVDGHLAEDPTSVACKVRVTVNRDGRIFVTASQVPALAADPTLLASSQPSPVIQLSPSQLEIDTLSVVLDSRPTETSIFTMSKTTYRMMYDQARDRNNISFHPKSPFDVILFNHSNQLTETSICNFAVHRPPYWVTPPCVSGCLPGVFRRLLVEKGLIREANVGELTLDNLRNGEWVLLFNGVQGCKLGRLEMR